MRGGRGTARRRRDGPVHRPLPQGGHRRRSTTPSCAPSRSGCGTCASSTSAGPRSSSRSTPRASSIDALAAQIMLADTKARLEDIYLPFKPKRRTKAQIAARGRPRTASPTRCWPTRPRPEPPPRRPYAEGVPTPPRLDGARAILVERFAEDADLVGELRERMWTRGQLVVRGPRGQGDRGRQVRRLLRVRRALHQAALAPDPGDVPRREGGGPRPDPRPRDRGARRRADVYEGRIARRFGVADRGPPGRPVAARHGPLGLADPDPRHARHRPADAAAAVRRGRRRRRVRRQPARPAAGRARRHPRHDGPRPGLPHRREGRRRRRHRQGASPPT